MRLHERSGDRAAALTHYRAAVQMLATELGVEPDPATQRLYQRHPGGERAAGEQRPSRPRVPSSALRRTVAAGAADVSARRPSGAARPARWRPPRTPPLAAAGRRRRRRRHRQVAPGRRAAVVDRRRARARAAAGSALDGLAGRVPRLGARAAVSPVRRPAERGGRRLRRGDAAVGRLAGGSRPAGAGPGRAAAATCPRPPGSIRSRRRGGCSKAWRAFWARCPAPRLLVIEDLHWADEGSLRLLDYLAHHEALRSTLLVTTVRSEDVDEQLAGRAARTGAPAPAGAHRARTTGRRGHRPAAARGRARRRPPARRAAARRDRGQSAVRGGDDSVAARIGRAAAGESARDRGRRRCPSRSRPRSGHVWRAWTRTRTSWRARRRCSAATSTSTTRAASPARTRSARWRRSNGCCRRTCCAKSPAMLGEALYSFSHDKVRQVVYDDLSAARRRVQHRRALDVLAQPAARTPLERLAYHAHARPGLGPGACAGASRRPTRRSRCSRTARRGALYEQALEGLERLPVRRITARTAYRLRLRLAQVAFYVAPGRLGEWLEPAERDAQALGDPTLLAYVSLAQAGALYIQGRFAEALPLLDRIRPIAESTARSRCCARSSCASTASCRRCAATTPRRCPRCTRRSSSCSEQPGIELTVATEMLGATYAYMGDFDRALELISRRHAYSESVHDQAALAAGEGFLCGRVPHAGRLADGAAAWAAGDRDGARGGQRDPRVRRPGVCGLARGAARGRWRRAPTLAASGDRDGAGGGHVGAAGSGARLAGRGRAAARGGRRGAGAGGARGWS